MLRCIVSLTALCRIVMPQCTFGVISDEAESKQVSCTMGELRDVLHNELEHFFQRLSEQHLLVGQLPGAPRAVAPPSSTSIASSGEKNSAAGPSPCKHSEFASSPALIEPLLSGPESTGQHVQGLSVQSHAPKASHPSFMQTVMGKKLSDKSNTDHFVTGKEGDVESNADFPGSSDDLDDAPHKTSRQIALSVDTQTEDQIKQWLQEALAEVAYNVEDHFHETGWTQAWARSNSCFSVFSLVVVFMNVIWIGIDIDFNKAIVLSRAPLASQIINNMFAVFFCFEILVRFVAFKSPRSALKDHHFIFDLILVAFGIWTTWIEVLLFWLLGGTNGDLGYSVQLVRGLRLGRLTRIPRIYRVAALYPELLVLVNGVAAAMRSVFAIMLLLTFTIYVFGTTFTTLMSDTPEFGDSFANVPTSMNTLMLTLLCGPDSDFMIKLLHYDWRAYCVYLCFLFLGILTMLNLLVGVLCDVAAKVAEKEKEEIRSHMLEHHIGIITSELDEDADGSISGAEFEHLLQRKSALRALSDLGIDVVSFGRIAREAFDGGNVLSLHDFCRLVLEFRIDMVSSHRDNLETRQVIANLLEMTAQAHHSLGNKIEEHAEAIKEHTVHTHRSLHRRIKEHAEDMRTMAEHHRTLFTPQAQASLDFEMAKASSIASPRSSIPPQLLHRSSEPHKGSMTSDGGLAKMSGTVGMLARAVSRQVELKGHSASS